MRHKNTVTLGWTKLSTETVTELGEQKNLPEVVVECITKTHLLKVY